MRLFRILTYLYPKPFRREYQGPLEQAFRDQLRRRSNSPARLWLDTLVDILKTAPILHLEENMQKIAAPLLGLAAALFLARFELHSDDTGIEVGLLLLFTFALGYWQPKHAWLYSFIGIGIPVAELVWGAPPLKKVAEIWLFVMTLSIAGTVSGVLVRQFFVKRPAQ